jgi:hypothetical protein
MMFVNAERQFGSGTAAGEFFRQLQEAEAGGLLSRRPARAPEGALAAPDADVPNFQK